VIAQPLELEGGDEPDEGARTRLRQTEATELDRCESRQLGLRDDASCAACARHSALDRTRTPRLDQLATDRAQSCVGNRRGAKRPVPDERAGGGPDQRVARESLVKRAGVVVEREHEACSDERLGVRRAHDDAAVRALPGGRGRIPGQGPSPSPGTSHQAQPVRPDGCDEVLHHLPSVVGERKHDLVLWITCDGLGSATPPGHNRCLTPVLGCRRARAESPCKSGHYSSIRVCGIRGAIDTKPARVSP